MIFSSIPFLFYFFPAVLICYFIVPKSAKNTVLLIFSLLFYAWGEPKYVFLMLASISVGYVAGIIIEKSKGKKIQKIVLIISVLLCISGLICFKYADFFIRNFNLATGLSIPLLRLALPIGISFYSFQIISYLIDVYRGETSAQRNFINLAAYVSLFAQLIAGPIVRYSDIAGQLSHRKHSFSQCMDGIRRFITGLGKKILIANILGELVNVFRSTSEPSVGFFWIYAVAYSLHLYFDFSGYSDMAIGIGKIFGFNFLENFNYPFISASITEFWRRWHISLGSWFRDYVYIPLGGNKVSRLKWYRNIFVVWMLTGFWHGADWNFILWGVMFAVLLMVEKAGLISFLKKYKVFAHGYVLIMVVMSFVIFNANGISQMLNDFKGLFGMADIPLWSEHTEYYLRSYSVILIISAIGSTPLPVKFINKVKKLILGKTESGTKLIKEGIWGTLEYVFLVGLLLVCTAFLIDGSFNPFLYFRF